MNTATEEPEIFVAVSDEAGRIVETVVFGTEPEAMAWALGRTVDDVAVALYVGGREVWAGA